MKRTRAQRRWWRRGYTSEATSWSNQSGRKPFSKVLYLKPTAAAHLRKRQHPDDWVRPICPVFFHNGKKPR